MVQKISLGVGFWNRPSRDGKRCEVSNWVQIMISGTNPPVTVTPTATTKLCSVMMMMMVMMMIIMMTVRMRMMVTIPHNCNAHHRNHKLGLL